jgi:hypothetical protein
MSTIPPTTIPRHPQIPQIKRWQTTGYLKFSEFLASDNELFIVRRFKTLNARLILRMQDEICMLEADLTRCDKAQMEAVVPIDNGSFRHDKAKDRKVLLDTIQTKLKEYSLYFPHHVDVGWQI